MNTKKTQTDLIAIEKLGQQVDDKFQEWKKFAFQNRTLETIIAFTLGVAFSRIVAAVSEGLVMPLIHYVGAYTGRNWRDIVWQPTLGLTFEVGKLYAAGIDFLLTSIVLFVLWKMLTHKTEGWWQKIVKFFRWLASWRIKIVKL